MADQPMSPAQQIALWADTFRDLSAMGLMFSRNPYDRGNYEKIQELALQMLALATGGSLEELDPLRAPVFNRPTPFVAGDAAIIDDAGRILLIRRADNRQWAMPGGALEVGETPAEGVVREALEETGVRCAPVALVGIYDSRLCGTVSRHHLYQLTFLCRPIDGGQPSEPPSHGFEVLDAHWFVEQELPPGLDPGHASRIPHAFRAWHGDTRAYFDGQPLPQATLCFLVRGDPVHEVLLGFKKVGFGAGKYGGFGGKVEPGEAVVEAAARELAEESGLHVVEENLQYRGRLTFVFPFRPAWGQVVHVFVASDWQGVLEESVEMAPRWFGPDEIPYDRMWHDSRFWLPRILNGERFRARFTFGADNETVAGMEIEAWENGH
jgi:8-oxo-dGTP pyrophosphatase MutT (NUDIX family)